MDSGHWQQLESLFDQASALPADQRLSFLEDAVADPGLIRATLDLLAAHDSRHRLFDAPSPAALPAGLRIGPYEVERILGAGGMGTVYLAHRADGQYERRVAVKVLTAGLASVFDGRHASVEREAMARLDHPCIARLLDSGINEFGQPYLVIEYVDGEPLDAWISAAKPSRATILRVWLDIAGAVAEAHRNLIVHRDLKPANVLISPGGKPKLLDFGVAKLLEESPALTGTQYFTARYCSPEQRGGHNVTTASDIYSLGVILREILPPLAGDLAAIVEMATRDEPSRRYPTVEQFAADVDRFLRGMPVAARPDSLFYRGRKFVARHKISAAAAVAGAGLLAASVIAIAQARRRAEKVTGYLTSVLGGSPAGQDSLVREKGANVRLSDLIQQMEREITRNPPDPEVEVELRQILGYGYLQMGLWEQARQNADRGRLLADRLFRPSDPRRNHLDLIHGGVQVQVGRFGEAEKVLRALRARLDDSQSFLIATSCLNLGVAQLRLGKLSEAERTFDDGLRFMDSVRRSAPDTAMWFFTNSSLVLAERGRFDAAIARLEQGAAIMREPLVPGAWILTNLAIFQLWTNHPDEALTRAHQALKTFEATLGPAHPSTIHAISVAAYVKSLRGDPEAETLIRRGVAQQDSALAPDHVDRAVGLSYLGIVLSRNGKHGEAIASLEKALVLRRRHFRPPNWRLAETEGWLGEALVRAGRHAEGLAALRASASAMEQVYGVENPRALAARQRLDRLGTSSTIFPPPR